MQLSAYLRALGQEAPSKWTGKILKYDLVCAELEALSQQRINGGDEGKVDREFDCKNDAVFLPLLHAEVTRVNREFCLAAKNLLRTPGSRSLQNWCLEMIIGSHPTESTNEELAMELEWCIKIAHVNRVALRTIVKMHDNYCGCRSANSYLQELWQGTLRSDGALLRSPLLRELEAKLTLLREEAGVSSPSVETSRPIAVVLSTFCGDSDAEQLPFLQSLADVATATSALLAHADPPVLQETRIDNKGADRGKDGDHVCPICLDIMYMPLGLECGHVFCAQCAFNSAGKANALGTVRAVLEHVAADSPCPECRTPGAFIMAMELKELNKLIQKRYPQEWAEAKASAESREKTLRQILHIRRQMQPHHNFQMSI